ncbi:MAG: Rne/Rng family ribonuclease, partial [Pyrinomonadaceae bacterium]
SNRESVSVDGDSRESGNRELRSRETGAREEGERPVNGRETGGREGGGRDGGDHENVNREANGREGGNREGGNRDGGNREGGREAGGRDGANREGGREVVGREAGGRDGGGRDRDSRDRGRRDSRGGRGDRPGGDGKRFDRNDRSGRPPQPTISDLLKEGQEILVQIAKEPIAKKGARITSHIALPGRYLVYMPTIEHLGVSRKIESATERARLRTLIQRIRQDSEIASGGFIVRTAGIGISEEDLRNDAKYLARMWADARKNSEKKKSPALVHQDLDLVQRILRDQLADNFTAIRVDNEEEYLRTVEFINLIQPRMVNRVKLYTRDEPILDYYGVQEEIDKALKPRVWLKSGGYLVINQTEALVAIDVNTGKFVGKGNARLEDTITRTNMEAVDEIARQIRLRDLGGIIVLDLIDMEDRRNRNKVSQALQEALSTDRSPTKVLSFNDFGLIIMTRKRVKQSLERTMCAPCDYCEGAGWVKSPTTVCYDILAEARRLSKSVDDVHRTTLRIHPDVATALRNSEREVLDEIESYLGNIDIASDKSIHQAQFDFAFV